ncbi:MAG TPA: YihY/virulence factor BrkB family protein [Bacteroidales bacterium]
MTIQLSIRRRLSFIVLPGFDGMPLYDVLTFFLQGLFKGVLTFRAAAIAYNFFLALVPFILFLFTLIPFVLGESIQAELLVLMHDLLPAEIFNLAENTIVEIVSRPSTGWLSVVFLTAVYFATMGIDTILESFGQSYHEVELWPWWKQKVNAFLLMFGLSIMIIFSMLLLGFGKYTLNYLESNNLITSQLTLFWLGALQWVIIVGLVLVSISVLYYFGEAKDKERNRYRFISAGSLLGTILFILGGMVLKLYFANFARYNLVFGSLGSIIVVLIWLYYNAQLLLIGFELNTSIRVSKAAKPKYKVVE